MKGKGREGGRKGGKDKAGREWKGRRREEKEEREEREGRSGHPQCSRWIDASGCGRCMRTYTLTNCTRD